jgi:hypothetical protein
MSPDLPADLFTTCLTTPIRIALRKILVLGFKVVITKNIDKHFYNFNAMI